MDFSLTPEQQLIRDTIRRYAQAFVEPMAARTDREERFPKEAVDGLAPLGFLGALIPPEYGGAGLDKVSYVLGLEELAHACASTSVIVGVHTSVAATPILWYGTEEQRRKFLPPLASGKRLGALAVTEPQAGSDVSAIRTSAVRKGKDYVLNGEKIFITNGDRAGQIVVAAKTDPKGEAHNSISLFVVEKGMKGFEVGGIEKKMGIRGSGTARLSFKDVHVPAGNLLGAEGAGFKQLMRVLNSSRLGIAAQANGLTRRALDESIEYAKGRKQFGVPIGKHQAIAFRLADMATRLEAARLVTFEAASEEDRGELRPALASMAKVLTSETAVWATNQAVQIHGGNGYIRDYVVERLMRDAKVTELYEGTSEIQRDVIGKALVNA